MKKPKPEPTDINIETEAKEGRVSIINFSAVVVESCPSIGDN